MGKQRDFLSDQTSFLCGLTSLPTAPLQRVKSALRSRRIEFDLRGIYFQVKMILLIGMLCLFIFPAASLRIRVLFPEVLLNLYPDGFTAKMSNSRQVPYGSDAIGELVTQEVDCTGFSKEAGIALVRTTVCDWKAAIAQALEAASVFIFFPEVESPSLMNINAPLAFLDSSVGDVLFEVSKTQKVLLKVSFEMDPRLDSDVGISDYQARSIYPETDLPFRPDQAYVPSPVRDDAAEGNLGARCLCPATPFSQRSYLHCILPESSRFNSFTEMLPTVSLAWEHVSCEECTEKLTHLGLDVTALSTCMLHFQARTSLYDLTETDSHQLTLALCASFPNPAERCSELFCSPGCWIGLLSNEVCDMECNTLLCNFDNGACEAGLNAIQSMTRQLQTYLNEQGNCTHQGSNNSSSCQSYSLPAWAGIIISVMFCSA